MDYLRNPWTCIEEDQLVFVMEEELLVQDEHKTDEVEEYVEERESLPQELLIEQLVLCQS